MDIENLVELATPGPWIADEGMVNAPGLNIVECSDPVGDDWDNARFIAASREAVPDLIAEVRRLEGIILDLETYLDNVQNSELDSDTIRRILEV